jgi:hypothetical protein
MGKRKSTEKQWAKKIRLYNSQQGLCHYCKNDMLLVPPKFAKRVFELRPALKNFCTFEHLDDRWSSERGKHPGETRVVLACNECNQFRNLCRGIERGITKLEPQKERLQRHMCNAITPYIMRELGMINQLLMTEH